MTKRIDRNQVFDQAGNLISEEVVEVDIAAEVNEASITDKIRAAIDDNVTALGQLSTAVGNITNNVITPTAANLSQANAQIDNLAQVVKNLAEQSGRMMRQITAIERLLIGSDLLESDEGT
jgi:uncharacterized protein (DUF2342 family)